MSSVCEVRAPLVYSLWCSSPGRRARAVSWESQLVHALSTNGGSRKCPARASTAAIFTAKYTLNSRAMKQLRTLTRRLEVRMHAQGVRHLRTQACVRAQVQMCAIDRYARRHTDRLRDANASTWTGVRMRTQAHAVRTKILDLAILAFNDTHDVIRRVWHTQHSSYHANATIAFWDRMFDSHPACRSLPVELVQTPFCTLAVVVAVRASRYR